MKQGHAAPTGSRPSQMPPAASLSAPSPAQNVPDCHSTTSDEPPMQGLSHEARPSSSHRISFISNVNGSIYISIVTCAGCAVFLCAYNLSNCNAIEISASKLHPQQLHANASDIASRALAWGQERVAHPDGSTRDAQLGLRLHKHIVPQARLQVALHLGQVEVGACRAQHKLQLAYLQLHAGS